MSTVLVTIAIVALFFTWSMQLSPCSGVAHAAQCNVGDDETFTGPVSFEDEINAGAAPGPGDFGAILTSKGAGVPAEWDGQFVVKAATETISSDNTLSDDAELVGVLAASTAYHVEGLVLFDTGTTPDIQFNWNFPSGGWTFDGEISFDTQDGSSTNEFNKWTEAAAEAQVADGNTGVIKIDGVLVTDATSGNAALQWAQNTSDPGNTSVLLNSHLRFTELN